MKNDLFLFLTLLGVCVFSVPTMAQDPSTVLNFDVTAEGPWSDIAKTTLTVPKVADNQVKLDGSIGTNEYGGFKGVAVVPGDNAWILDFAEAMDWQSPADTSFTFYLAYDSNFLYIGMEVKDDVVISNDPPAQFWKDDSMEILIDPLDTRYDTNLDGVENFFGGHAYFNWEGKFSSWENEAKRGLVWCTLADWAYGETKEIYGFGKEVTGGYVTEVKIHKVTLIDPISTFKWQEGQSMAFNIGLDDDDGANLALQYWWANRIRAIGYNADTMLSDGWTDQEIAKKAFLDPNYTIYNLAIDSTGRLTPGGAGDIKLGPMGQTSLQNWSLF